MEVVSLTEKDQHLLNAYFEKYTEKHKHKVKRFWSRG
jgi:hypothetical protein